MSNPEVGGRVSLKAHAHQAALWQGSPRRGPPRGLSRQGWVRRPAQAASLRGHRVRGVRVVPQPVSLHAVPGVCERDMISGQRLPRASPGGCCGRVLTLSTSLCPVSHPVASGDAREACSRTHCGPPPALRGRVWGGPTRWHVYAPGGAAAAAGRIPGSAEARTGLCARCGSGPVGDGRTCVGSARTPAALGFVKHAPHPGTDAVPYGHRKSCMSGEPMRR